MNNKVQLKWSEGCVKINETKKPQTRHSLSVNRNRLHQLNNTKGIAQPESNRSWWQSKNKRYLQIIRKFQILYQALQWIAPIILRYLPVKS